MKNKNIKFKNNPKTARCQLEATRGFSLVETLVAISVLLLAVVGPLTIAARGLISARFARDQVTAFYLAQDAMEVVRYRRDTNTLRSLSWTTGLEECIAQTCIVDSTKDIDDTSAISSCGAVCPALRTSPTNGLYGHNELWDEGGFVREVQIDMLGTAEARVIVRVTWTTGPLAKTFTISENFLDWQ